MAFKRKKVLHLACLEGMGGGGGPLGHAQLGAIFFGMKASLMKLVGQMFWNNLIIVLVFIHIFVT